jgi:Ni/Co efflux regulator RcnB
MKRSVLATAAAALMLGAAGAAAAQPSYNYDHRGDYSNQRGDYSNHRYDDRRGDDRNGGYDRRGGYDNHGRYDNHSRYVRHNEWRRGYRMSRNDWGRGQRIDYRAYRLHAPPRGYEWREVDGNYVMAAIATGLIASIIANQY